MNHTLSLRVALQSGAGAAETQLALIAETAGDQQLALVIAECTPAEIAVMVSEADMSKPSLAHTFISTEQFLEAFSRLGTRWGDIPSNFDTKTFQRDVEDFLCPMILASEEVARRGEMIRAFMEHELAAETLVFLSFGHKEAEGFFTHPHGYPIARGTWQELVHLVYEHQPPAFHEVANLVREVAVSEEGEHPFALSLLRALCDEARLRQSAEAPESEEEEFVDI